MKRSRSIGWLALAGLVLATAAFTFSDPGNRTHLTAYFTRSTSLYVGDDVRVLGVRVGRIDGIHPEGDRVRVDFSVDGSRKVPADVKAAIISPSLVASRYVQLAPAYTGGPTLQNGSVIPLSRTVAPVEWDDVKQQLTELATALGPHGANKDGSLNRAITVVADNLGNGTAAQLNHTLSGMSDAVDALTSGRGDLFNTVRSLQSFISNLNANDGEVRAFSAQLTDVSALLADNKIQLATALDTMDQALGDLSRFLKGNRQQLRSSVTQLSELSTTLAGQSGTLADILHVVPTALANVYNIRDPRHGAFTGRLSVNNFQGLAQLACGAVFSLSPTTSAGTDVCRAAVQPLLDLLGLSSGIPGTPGVPLTPAKPGAPAKSADPLGGVISTVTGTLQGVLGLLLPGSGS